MNKNKVKERKLMKVFDASYNQTFSLILSKVQDREDAKKLLGRIYKETWDALTTQSTGADTEAAFENTKAKYGLQVPLQS